MFANAMQLGLLVLGLLAAQEVKADATKKPVVAKNVTLELRTELFNCQANPFLSKLVEEKEGIIPDLVELVVEARLALSPAGVVIKGASRTATVRYNEYAVDDPSSQQLLSNPDGSKTVVNAPGATTQLRERALLRVNAHGENTHLVRRREGQVITYSPSPELAKLNPQLKDFELKLDLSKSEISSPLIPGLGELDAAADVYHQAEFSGTLVLLDRKTGKFEHVTVKKLAMTCASSIPLGGDSQFLHEQSEFASQASAGQDIAIKLKR